MTFSPPTPRPERRLEDRWRDLFASHLPLTMMTTGRQDVAAGRIRSLVVEAGRVRAVVQSRGPVPHEVLLHVPRLDAAAWDRVIEAMGSEAIHMARLLADQLSRSIDEPFQRAGHGLLPGPDEAIEIECTCGTTTGCHHVAAAVHAVADRLVEEPTLVLTLRGHARDRLIERLREARTLRTRGVTTAHPPPHSSDPASCPPHLSECLDTYWRCGSDFADFEASLPDPGVSHALLRRLGPSPLAGRFPLVGLLASIYDSITEGTTAMLEEAPMSTDGLRVDPL